LSTIDLNTPPPNHQFSVSVEREESPAEQGVRLFKDVMLFLVAIGFVALIIWLCFHTLQDKQSSADAQKWAMSVLSAATGGIIGYLVRK
jgi:flagellar biogenesis protein FliO